NGARLSAGDWCPIAADERRIVFSFSNFHRHRFCDQRATTPVRKLDSPYRKPSDSKTALEPETERGRNQAPDFSSVWALCVRLPPARMFAQGQTHPIDKTLEACIDKNGFTAGMVECTDKAPGRR